MAVVRRGSPSEGLGSGHSPGSYQACQNVASFHGPRLDRHVPGETVYNGKRLEKKTPYAWSKDMLNTYGVRSFGVALRKSWINCASESYRCKWRPKAPPPG